MEPRKKQKLQSNLRIGGILAEAKWEYLAILATLHLQKPKKRQHK
jgi:hypothetical protein